MINEIYKGLPHELDAELKEIESVLLNVQQTFPEIARTAAQKRFKLEMARARERERLETMPLAEGEKKPTIPSIDAKIDLATEAELELSRDASAELEIAKVVFDSVKTRLTSIQTRSRMTQAEMSLAR